jgi:hypothetical protein
MFEWHSTAPQTNSLRYKWPVTIAAASGFDVDLD